MQFHKYTQAHSVLVANYKTGYIVWYIVWLRPYWTKWRKQLRTHMLVARLEKVVDALAIYHIISADFASSNVAQNRHILVYSGFRSGKRENVSEEGSVIVIGSL